jgi:hypothetical protein
MSPYRNVRLPISTRHALALAFDLAVRRDALQSIVVPLALHAPWILAIAMLPPITDTDQPAQVLLLGNVALVGDFLVQVTVGAMLRFRARSVFNTAPDVRPAPALECYAKGLQRLPWLFVTEVVRNFLLLFAAFFLVVPAIFLGFRLSFATEAVVLSEPHMAGAFQRSFRFTQGRFERWLEMIVVSVFLGFAAIAVALLGALVLGSRGLPVLVPLMIAGVTPIIQYAWTFFYLRLVEIEEAAPGVEVGPAYAAEMPAALPEIGSPTPSHPPALTLVQTSRQEPEEPLDRPRA